MAGVAAASSDARRSENVVNCLEDPVSLEPLYTCVRLLQCDHAMNEDTALQLFGARQEGTVNVISRNPCPVCRATVTGYKNDFLIRSIVHEFKEENIDHTVEQIRGLFREHVTKVRLEPPRPQILPPLSEELKGKFRVTGNNFDQPMPQAWGCGHRDIYLTSSRNDSLICWFNFQKKENGELSICLQGKSFEKLNQYFAPLNLLEVDDKLVTNTDRQLVSAFKMIVDNNELPEDCFQFMKRSIEEYIEHKQ